MSYSKKFYCYLLTYFTPFSSVSFVDFEQINVSWVVTITGKIHFHYFPLTVRYFPYLSNAKTNQRKIVGNKAKSESQNRGNKKAKHAKFSKKSKQNIRFSENLACFTFSLPPFWDSPFCIITDEICRNPYTLKISAFKGYKMGKLARFGLILLM